MAERRHSLKHAAMKGAVTTAATLLVVLAMVATSAASSGKKKKKAAAPLPAVSKLDYSKFKWPPAPAITRVQFLDFFSAEKIEETPKGKKSSGWMDRIAGVSEKNDKRIPKLRFELLTPYGMAVDSKGRLYVADGKVGAVFIFNTETRDVEMIKHGIDAEFGRILGLFIDDSDQLFVTDGVKHHVLVFDANHKLRSQFGDAVLKGPCGIAIDFENRFIYIADTELDQVLVFDADTYKLLRRIGTTGKQHTLTSPGDFSKPTNVAVNQQGDLYVTDTFNDRVEVFDADGTFIRAFGKNGDGPGDFARPKGIAIDPDGHVWVADAMLCRLQVFTPEGRLLMGMGEFGQKPGQFQSLTGLAIDKNNRIFASDQFPGRVEMFRYIPDADARVEFERRKAEADAQNAQQSSTSSAEAPAAASAAPPRKGMKLAPPEVMAGKPDMGDAAAQKQAAPPAQSSPPQ
jgi:sugar lactone lactonase YvrE